jgi:hypothetical protein
MASTGKRLQVKNSLCFNQGLILPTFYKLLFCVQIPKVQKDSLFALLGSAHVKASRKHVGEIDLCMHILSFDEIPLRYRSFRFLFLLTPFKYSF